MPTKYIAIIITILIAIIFFNIDSTTKKGVDYSINEENINLYVKINDFYKRHKIYLALNKKIFDENTISDNFLILSRWIYKNIDKLEKNDQIIDDHPSSILLRKKGANDQFNDILSILLVYSGYEAFYKNLEYFNSSYPLTFVKIDDYWTVIDPYNGFYFLNSEKKFASINDFKKNNYIIKKLNNDYTFKSNEKIFFFGNNVKISEVNKQINSIFNKFDPQKEIYKKHKYLRGGRSYFQDPFNRVHYILLKFFRLI